MTSLLILLAFDALGLVVYSLLPPCVSSIFYCPPLIVELA